MARRLLALALVLAAPLAAACREDTVAVAFEPEVGDVWSYRYEIDATVTTVLDGGSPMVTEIATTLLADQEVVQVTDDGVQAEVTLRRDGGAARTAEVRLDRAGSLQGLDLVSGEPLEVFGLSDLGGVLPTVALPDGRLAPGDRWAIDDGLATGTGRLVRLGVVDGREVAVVASDTRRPVAEVTPTQGTTAALEGELRARSTSTYDLGDGSLRRARSTARGDIEARIAPPSGVDAPAVPGTISYEVRVEVTRLP